MFGAIEGNADDIWVFDDIFDVGKEGFGGMREYELLLVDRLHVLKNF